MFFGSDGPASGRQGNVEDWFDRLHQASRHGAKRGLCGKPQPQVITADLSLRLADLFRKGKHTVQLRDPNTGQGRKLEVTIPPGVTDGSTIRLPGALAETGGGDLLLKIRLAADDRFEVHGHNLHTDVKLAPWEAALGVEVDVPLPDGKVTLTVHRDRVRASAYASKARDCPKTGGSRGDVLARLMIVMPKTLSGTNAN